MPRTFVCKQQKNKTMQVSYIRSQGLLRGFRVKQYEDHEIAKLAADSTTLRLVTDCVNKDRRQKVCLVDARSQFLDKLCKLTGYVRPTTTATVEGEAVETLANTEGKDIDAIRAQLTAGTLKHASVSGKTNEEREPQVETLLQNIADSCGDTDDTGKPLETPPCFVCDVRKAERAPAKPKEPNKRAIANATNIINNGSEEKWVTKFTKGYTSPTGGAIPPISFLPFTTKPAKGADAAAVEAVRQTNIKNLAFAIMAVEEHARRNQEAEKAKEFA
jgi:hypothetical protein